MERLRLVEGKPEVASWCKDPDKGTKMQLEDIVKLPFLSRVALMPDAHVGYGVPIGTVLETLEVVIPNAVGVDIGCGMRFKRFDLKAKALKEDDLKAILGRVRELVPVGFAHRKDPLIAYTLYGLEDEGPLEVNNAGYSLGTLGGGNHFIELQEDTEGFLCAMIHTGSRNFGFKIAGWYHRLARELRGGEVPDGLAYLPIGSPEGEDYLYHMQIAMDFAQENRAVLMEKVTAAIGVVGMAPLALTELDVHHNYAEVKDGKVIHRKGAIDASAGVDGIIPGSQGTMSYLTNGKGVEVALNSSSHGAGRVLGRGEAKKKLDLATEQAKMAGILHSVRGVADLDEAPGAYKNIDEVMAAQEDLTEVVGRLRPLGVVKG